MGTYFNELELSIFFEENQLLLVLFEHELTLIIVVSWVHELKGGKWSVLNLLPLLDTCATRPYA